MGSTLDGVTTAVVLFLFTCLVVPGLVKNHTQYYAAFGCALGIIAMNTVALMIQSERFNVFAGVIIGFLQLVAVSMLVMCAGGMSVKTLAGEMGHAYEVIRRGGEEKEVIVPLTGEKPMPRDPDAPRPRIEINDPAAPPPTTPKPTDESIPLE
jgi:hypothetical protein